LRAGPVLVCDRGMAHRRSREWWADTVARWRRSGLTAAEFAARHGVRATTLRWWSSRQRDRVTRAEHGRTAVPIEIAVPSAGGAGAGGTLTIDVGGVVVHCEVGADVEYVAALVKALAS
jgi:hypothetical protein